MTEEKNEKDRVNEEDAGNNDIIEMSLRVMECFLTGYQEAMGIIRENIKDMRDRREKHIKPNLKRNKI